MPSLRRLNTGAGRSGTGTGGTGGGGSHASMESDNDSSKSPINIKSHKRSVSSSNNNSNKPLPPPVLIYHDSARSIVFRDHLRRAVTKTDKGKSIAADAAAAAATKNNQKSVFDRQHSLPDPSSPSSAAAPAGPPQHSRDHHHFHHSSSMGDDQKAKSLESATLPLVQASYAEHYQQQEEQNKAAAAAGVDDNKNPLERIASEIFHLDDTVVPSEAGLLPTQIANYQPSPSICPLEPLLLGQEDEFHALLKSPPDNGPDWTPAEAEVVNMLQNQRAVCKTLKNTDWTAFLKRFKIPVESHSRWSKLHDDIPPPAAAAAAAVGPRNNSATGSSSSDDQYYHFNSFVTSTTMLPPGGKKMRCFGSPSLYTTGVVFALPTYPFGNDNNEDESEEEACVRTETWSWPAGYSAKTEFNIDGRGKLINGRQEALRSLSVLRQYNHDYLTKDEYMVANRQVSGLNQIPYNEVFLRVGGLGRIVQAQEEDDDNNNDAGFHHLRSFDRGVGLPVALFCRTATFGHLLSLLRTRARLSHVLGEQNIKGIPLLLITPEDGVRVFSEKLQRDLWKIASRSLNPFQNSTIAHKTTVDNTNEESFQQKVDELLDLDESIQKMLTPEELARLAGGFGATDESVATILRQVMIQDRKINRKQQNDNNNNKKHHHDGDAASFPGGGGVHQDFAAASAVVDPSHKLQDVVNEGLASAVRAGDYHTSRQLLILYSLVASRADELDDEANNNDNDDDGDDSSLSDVSTEHKSAERPGCPLPPPITKKRQGRRKPRLEKKDSGLGRGADSLLEDLELVKKDHRDKQLSTAHIPPPPPPPPLDTDRLRSATNSDGLLAVLGAAQVLKAIQEGSCRRRAEECISAVEEWINYGEQSMAFRISSWYDQRAAQGDLQIATENNTSFMAFVSNKAISNRKAFAGQLRQIISSPDFTEVRFLHAVNQILSGMHSPCLRLELLQYVLGLDNRYSVAHVARSVELAATCLDISYGASRITE